MLLFFETTSIAILTFWSGCYIGKNGNGNSAMNEREKKIDTKDFRNSILLAPLSHDFVYCELKQFFCE